MCMCVCVCVCEEGGGAHTHTHTHRDSEANFVEENDGHKPHDQRYNKVYDGEPVHIVN